MGHSAAPFRPRVVCGGRHSDRCRARSGGVTHRCRCTGQFLGSTWRPVLRPDLAIVISRRAQTPSRSAVTARVRCCDASRPHLDGGEHCGMLEASRGRSATVLEAPAIVAGLNVAVMREAIQQRRRHLGIDEDARAFAKGQIGRDDDVSASSLWNATRSIQRQQEPPRRGPPPND